MEKVINGKKYIFKDKLNMSDWQKFLAINTEYARHGDEMLLAFDLFGEWCVEIDGVKQTKETAKEHIKNIEDVSVYADIRDILMNKLDDLLNDNTEKKKN